MPKLTLKKFIKYSKPSSVNNSSSKSKLTKKIQVSKKNSLSNSNSLLPNSNSKKDNKNSKNSKDIKDRIKDKTLLNYIPPVNKNIVYPKNKLWDLMMKNVYSIGAYQVGQQGFRMNFLYNNPATSLPVPFFP